MAAYFVDSSGIVKNYVEEVGSTWVASLLAPGAGHEIYVARIAAVEVVSAITRRARGGSVGLEDAEYAREIFKSDLQNEYSIVEVTENLVNLAVTLAEDYGLRGYDAVQLAAACEVNRLYRANGLPPLVFVSADDDLNEAATPEGLLVENPSSHP